MRYSFKVKIVGENKANYKIKLLATNRTMPIKKDIFDERVKQGMYEVIQ